MKQRYIIMVVLIGLLVILSVNLSYAQFAGGDGSEENPYLVESAEHLNEVRNYPKDHFRQITDIDLGDFAQGEGWETIKEFFGTYYGSGYSITNLKIHRTTTDNVGLFGSANEATIGGIKLIDVEIYGRDNVGSLLGWNENSNIELNYVSGFIHGRSNTGGLVGYQNNGLLIESSSTSHVEGAQNIGGIVGSLNYGEVKNCFALGTIHGERYIGGLIGSYAANGIVFNSYAAGRVSGERDTGGLIGYGNGTAVNSYWDMEITGQRRSAGGEGRRKQEMTYPYDPDTYVDWDFVYKWLEDEHNLNEDYPYLFRAPSDIIPWPLFSGGDGTENNPFLVENAFQLNWIRHPNFLTKNYRQISDIDLGVAPWNLNEGWLPIGNAPTPYGFTGYYDGNGYSIVNLFIDRNSADVNWDQLGLFGFIYDSAFVQGLNLDNVNISGRNFVGGLSGLIQLSNIIHVKVSGHIKGISWVGGITGVAAHCSIESNYCSALIENIAGSPALRGVSGGLVGFSSWSEFSNSTATGDVLSVFGGLVGGLIGEATHSSVIDCSATGDITSSNHSFVGGIVGYAASINITNSFATGNIEGNEAVGGLAGEIVSNSVINQSYATGTVTGDFAVGGLAGYSGLPVPFAQPCYIENSYATGDVHGNSHVGGLVGFHGPIGNVENCYSIGPVNRGEAGHHVGGLIGYNAGNVANCFWDRVTSGQEYSAAGTGLLTVDMLPSNDIYTNWNFQNIWDLRNYTTYPYLRWQADPAVQNYPPHGYHKVFRDRIWYWESFPVLWDRDQGGYQDGSIVLDPLTNHMNTVLVYNEEYGIMFFHYTDWHNVYDFHSTRGYKLGLIDQNEYSLIVEGDTGTPENIEFDAEVALYPRSMLPENFIGYFIPQTQCVFDAFSEIIDDLVIIQSEEWGLYRNEFDQWEYDVNIEPKVLYGKFYAVTPREDLTETIYFQWNIPTEPEYWVPRPKPEFFVYTEKAAYESFFIEYIEDDEDVLEVAVFADDECVGATVFLGGYPFEILAYTDESHIGAEISFVIHRSGQRSEPEVIRVVDAKDNISGEYSLQILKPLRQRYTVVRLGTGEYEPETEIKPLIMLSQNYPNPIVFKTADRFNITSIPFYVSQDREVTLSIYNIRGQLVKTLYSGIVIEGRHSIGWNGMNDQNRTVGSGVYFYRLESGDTVITRKMLIIR
ncbi:MAG: T9SS type A sorting domain-containing protein [Candidatus Cloacimonetes bacterium]|nr:T9SS type A sorting domain-containing protein [Candidatus Cloacimonadota bacterium]